jgi:hypothetical protein
MKNISSFQFLPFLLPQIRLLEKFSSKVYNEVKYFELQLFLDFNLQWRKFIVKSMILLSFEKNSKNKQKLFLIFEKMKELS